MTEFRELRAQDTVLNRLVNQMDNRARVENGTAFWTKPASPVDALMNKVEAERERRASLYAWDLAKAQPGQVFVWDSPVTKWGMDVPASVAMPDVARVAREALNPQLSHVEVAGVKPPKLPPPPEQPDYLPIKTHSEVLAEHAKNEFNSRWEAITRQAVHSYVRDGHVEFITPNGTYRYPEQVPAHSTWNQPGYDPLPDIRAAKERLEQEEFPLVQYHHGVPAGHVYFMPEGVQFAPPAEPEPKPAPGTIGDKVGYAVLEWNTFLECWEDTNATMFDAPAAYHDTITEAVAELRSFQTAYTKTTYAVAKLELVMISRPDKENP